MLAVSFKQGFLKTAVRFAKNPRTPKMPAPKAPGAPPSPRPSGTQVAVNTNQHFEQGTGSGSC